MSLLRSRKFGRKLPKVNLGNDAPLTQETIFGGEIEANKGFHYGWFASLVLAGFAGATLILGALYAANDSNFVSVVEERGQPKINPMLSTGYGDNSIAGAKKTNRLQILPLLAQIRSERETVELTQVALRDGRQIIEKTPYTRIDIPLARSRSSLTDDIPKFNPVSMMTAAADIQENITEIQDDVKVDDDQQSRVMMTLAEFDQNSDFADNQKLSIHFIESDILSYLVPQAGNVLTINNAGFDGSEYQLSNIIQFGTENQTIENSMEDIQITYFEKTPFSELVDNISRQESIDVKPDDALSLLLQNVGIEDDDITNIIAAVALRFNVDDLSAGQKINIGYGFASDLDPREKPLRIQILDENRTLVAVALSTNGRYVPLAMSAELNKAQSSDESISLYYSIYETALRSKVPRHIADQIIRIFSFDVDYNKKAKPNDSLKLIFDRKPDEMENARLMYAALTINGEEKALYRFQTPDDGYTDYYNENGQSARKFLLRKPVHAGEFRSGFGMRRHPVYGTMRMHNGVDWRARTGTPIVAAGDGRIIKASWAGGYGRQVKISHKYGYVSSYSHMSRYGKGISEGAYVRQGQVIGYVGTSGLSTGPHLHYELFVNNSRVDPMGIRLPRGKDLKGDMQVAFEEQKNLITRILEEKTNQRFANNLTRANPD